MDLTKVSQDRVEALLQPHSLFPEKFKKEEVGRGKSPDFRVYKDNKFAFYCEVKCAQQDVWLDDKIMRAPHGVVGRPDPTFNRLTAHIHKAIQQFNDVNPDMNYPNVIAFVNFDWGSDYNDLIGVLNGQFISDDGNNYPIYAQYSEGRIRYDKYRIHLYLWIDELLPGTQVYTLNGPRNNCPVMMLFNIFDYTHLSILCNYFNVEEPLVGHNNHWFKRPLP